MTPPWIHPWYVLPMGTDTLLLTRVDWFSSILQQCVYRKLKPNYACAFKSYFPIARSCCMFMKCHALMRARNTSKTRIINCTRIIMHDAYIVSCMWMGSKTTYSYIARTCSCFRARSQTLSSQRIWSQVAYRLEIISALRRKGLAITKYSIT